MTGSDMDSKLQKYSLKEREEIKKQYCGPIGTKGGEVMIFKHNGITYQGMEEDILALRIALETSGYCIISDKIKVTYQS